jgi:hypothetical protein
MGDKGNYTPGKMLIGKVIGLFLGNLFKPDNVGQVLVSRYMLLLQPMITIKLDTKKLDRETSFIQHKDLAGILLNGVKHIYSRIYVTREREQTVVTEQVREGIDDVINEVVEYEP